MSGIAAGIGAAVSIGIFLVKNGKAKKKERAAQREKARIQRQISAFESSRQAITNPYAGVTSLAGLATDLSENLSNRYCFSKYTRYATSYGSERRRGYSISSSSSAK